MPPARQVSVSDLGVGLDAAVATITDTGTWTRADINAVLLGIAQMQLCLEEIARLIAGVAPQTTTQ